MKKSKWSSTDTVLRGDKQSNKHIFVKYLFLRLSAMNYRELLSESLTVLWKPCFCSLTYYKFGRVLESSEKGCEVTKKVFG